MTIKVQGTLVTNEFATLYRAFGRTVTTPDDVLKDVKENEDIELDINSGGGMVDAGSEIYTALKNHKGHVKANVVGMAASAASIVAMGADEVVMSPVATMMIHNVFASVAGDNRAHEKIADTLKKANQSLASAYMAKTGKSEKEILKMMDNTTYLTADEAVKEGFADSVMDFDGAKLAASNDALLNEEQLETAQHLLDQLNKPQPPNLSASIKGGKTTVTGSALAGAYIKADNHQGKKVGESHADGSGKVNFTISGLKYGDELRITQTDKWGTSKPKVINIGGEKPAGESDPKKNQNAETIGLDAESKELIRSLINKIDEVKTNQETVSWNDLFFNA
ncbi:head maturation protease, ClpP-related [Lacticaseibacillus rhamnosus]|uniref:head maturation protease, ClpP-related n=1 Tax=Lacticaseibacillus rhamnosus TaxID=47715 RepID=UPI00237EF140|nr:head maturation protease, ClpP-related [Lacticaseibacillus rhamnosus]MDE3295903.1 ATP-dependent Clp protease proteolytic subunit [Lacticaseibacillus rhamnosus]